MASVCLPSSNASADLNVHFKFHSSITAIGIENWNALARDDCPFLRYEFLSALEEEHEHHKAACCRQTGWQPYHMAAYEDKCSTPIAVMPLYIKGHSYGEYVFDWAWADAYQRNNLEYYPKLLAAIPFTPCTGPRILSGKTFGVDTEIQGLHIAVSKALRKECEDNQLSSAHLLFPEKSLVDDFQNETYLLREAVQFHWFNRNVEGLPYTDFDDFLSHLKARKRKAVKKERKQVNNDGLKIERLKGDEISDELWDHFHRFYQRTYNKRSGHGGYLPKHFFHRIGQTLTDNIMMVVAFRDEKPIAAALNFTSDDTLYGRYWGCTEEAEFLHFELCYYQGIEFCIENDISRYDAGAQGEHKIQRGFRPIRTFSCHWITRPDFRDAIDRFIDQEERYNDAYIASLTENLPFKIEPATDRPVCS